ncbi:MAG: DNA polymerase III subunit delta [Actinobacteria bacterium]|nr:DNA polymerase III subunit delta [Actinomycetota bacterium]MSX39250.1 DNA polymerase III subunit delta [Actinomycetota bacterium]
MTPPPSKRPASQKSASTSAGPKPAATTAPEAQVAHERAVLALGAEDFLAERVVAAVIAAARAIDPSVERRDVDLSSETALGALVEACSPNLFGDGAVVVARSAESADEQMVATLIESAAAGDIHLVVVHPGGVKGRKVADALMAHGFVRAPCEKAKGRSVDEFIAREFRAARRGATSDAIEALRIAIGDDLRGLAAACAQLVSDVATDPLTADSVAIYYDGVADVPGYLVADAVLGGRAVEVLRRTRWALANDPGAGPALSAAVAAGLRGLARVASLPRGLSEAEVAREAGVPPFKVRALREQAGRWHPAALAAALVTLARADAAVKGRNVAGRAISDDGLDRDQGSYVLERALLHVVSTRSGS